MKSILFIFFTFMLGAISASALAMPCTQTPRNSGDVHDSQHLTRLFVTQMDAAHLQQV